MIDELIASSVLFPMVAALFGVVSGILVRLMGRRHDRLDEADRKRLKELEASSQQAHRVKAKHPGIYGEAAHR